MKKLIIVTILILSAFAQNWATAGKEEGLLNSSDTAAKTAGKRVITDMAGRELEIPAVIEKVHPTMPIGANILYTLVPERVAGLNWPPTEYELEFLDKDYCELPVLGGWFSTYEGNVEEILKIGPDIILATARKDPKKSKTFSQQADKIQKQLAIPVVLIDTRLEMLGEAYKFLGGLFSDKEGIKERTEELARYCRDLLAEVGKISSTIPEGEKVGVYYAEGEDGLSTDLSGSMHSEIIELVGGINIAARKMAGQEAAGGMARISLEQILIWDPEVIVAAHDQGFAGSALAYDAVLNDPGFAGTKALKTGRVYEIPYKPFDITTKPPSVNRLLGIIWLSELLYPDYYDFDVASEFVEFYKLFYNIGLDNNQLDLILENAQ